jgi:hypothetical protein
MTNNDSSTKPKNMSEPLSFEPDGPWANAWCLQPYTFSSNGNQGQKDPTKSAEARLIPKRSSTSS